MKKIILLILLIFLVSNSIFSQTHYLGKSISKLSDNLGNIIVPNTFIAEGWENKVSPTLKLTFNKFTESVGKEDFNADNFISSNKFVSLNKTLNGNIFSIKSFIK